MLLEDENGLMPVMDGLVCWLDGRDLVGDEGNLSWYDRQGLCKVTNITEGYSDGFGYIVPQSPKTFPSLTEMLIGDSFTVEFDVLVTFPNSTLRMLPFVGAYTTNFYCSNWESNSNLWLNGTRIIKDNTYTTAGIDGLKHVAYAITKDTCRMYVNGQSVVEVEHKAPFPTTLSLSLGGYTSGLNNQISYKLNSFKIYNRALTEGEIQQNYLYEQSINRGE